MAICSSCKGDEGVTTNNWDWESRLTSITKPGTTTNTFGYNGLDARVSKTDTAGTKTYKRNGASVTAPVLGDGTTSFTPGISERAGTTSTFTHSGIKNSDTRTLAGQTIDGIRRYDAFGNLENSTGTWNSASGYGGPFGYQEDADHGLKLLGHRYYDPETGRFLSRDPIKDGRNWYSYCDNNPMRRIDPRGLDYHDPAKVKVSPHFKGKVFVSGETKSAPGKHVVTQLKPGQESNPDMDGDFLIVVEPDGTKKEYFLMGGQGFSMEYTVHKGGLDWSDPPLWLSFEGGPLDGLKLHPPHIPFLNCLLPFQRAWIEEAKKRPLPKEGKPVRANGFGRF